MQEKNLEMKRFAAEIRCEIVKMIARLPAGHLGGSMSIAELLSVLYTSQMRCRADDPQWEGRDWLVLSKGHCGPALYAALALKGFFPMEQLETLNQPATDLPSHCDRNRTPGIDMTTGSLGQGASTAAGAALGFKMDHADNRVFLILGDGEIDEGQVWEMALFASTKKLDNLIAFVDYNKMQLDGRTDTDEACCLGDIEEKFRAFGWAAQRVDGHDVAAIDTAIELAKRQAGKPSVIVLDTIKGKGWSGSAGKLSCHSQGIRPEELQQALDEIQAELRQAEKEVRA